MTENSWYKVFNGKNVLLEKNNVACFSLFTYGNVGDWTNITVMCPKENTVLTVKQIKQYIDDLNEMGFICSYNGNENGFYLFDIPTPEDEKLKYKKLYTISIMMLIRIMYHYGLTQIVNKYFELREKHDKFEALQLAHKQGAYGNSNHCILARLEKPIIKDEFYKRVAAQPPYANVNITYEWTKQ